MTAGVVDQLPLVDALPVAHLFDMQVDLQPAQPISTPLGTRLTFVVNGGTITGPALTGEVLPGGGDWLLVGADGVGRVDVRVTLRSHDDVLIHFESAGIIKVPADGLQRLAAGQALPFGETYVRTTPRLATSDERYARISRGRVGGRWFAQAPVLVLETVGRRSGERRITPVLYLRWGNALVVMAANAGSSRTPAWWLNLRDAGSGAVQVGAARWTVRPRELTGDERDRAWRAFVEMYPQAEHYTRFTERRFPLVALEPAPTTPAPDR